MAREVVHNLVTRERAVVPGEEHNLVIREMVVVLEEEHSLAVDEMAVVLEEEQHHHPRCWIDRHAGRGYWI